MLDALLILLIDLDRNVELAKGKVTSCTNSKLQKNSIPQPFQSCALLKASISYTMH